MTDKRQMLERAALVGGMIPSDFVGNDNYMKGVLDRWNPLENNGAARWHAVRVTEEGVAA